MALSPLFSPPGAPRTTGTAAPSLPFGPPATASSNPFSAQRLSAVGFKEFDEQAKAEADYDNDLLRQESARQRLVMQQQNQQAAQAKAQQTAADKAAKAAEAERQKGLGMEVTRANLALSQIPTPMTTSQRAKIEKDAAKKEAGLGNTAKAALAASVRENPKINEETDNSWMPFGLNEDPTPDAQALIDRATNLENADYKPTAQDLEEFRKVKPEAFAEVDSLKGALEADNAAREAKRTADTQLARAKAIKAGMAPEEADAMLATAPKADTAIQAESLVVKQHETNAARTQADIDKINARAQELAAEAQAGVSTDRVASLNAERQQIAVDLELKAGSLKAEHDKAAAAKAALETRRKAALETSIKPKAAVVPVESAMKGAKALPDGSFETAVPENLESLAENGKKVYWTDPKQDPAKAPTPEVRATKTAEANERIKSITETSKKISDDVAAIQKRIQERSDLTPEKAQAEYSAALDSYEEQHKTQQAALSSHLNDAMRDFREGSIDADTLNAIYHAANQPETGVEAFKEHKAELDKQDEHVAALTKTILGNQADDPGLNGEAVALSGSIAKNAEIYETWLNRDDSALTGGEASSVEAIGEAAGNELARDRQKLEALRESSKAKLAAELTKRGVPAEEQPALIARAQLESAQQSMSTLGQSVTSKGGVAKWVGSKMPFAGGVVAYNTVKPFMETALKLESGEKATQEELDALSEYLRFTGREQTWGALVGDIISALPGFMVELQTTGGLMTMARAGVNKSAAALVKKFASKEGRDLLVQAIEDQTSKAAGQWAKKSIGHKLALSGIKRSTRALAELARLPVASGARIVEKYATDSATQGIGLDEQEGRIVAVLDKDERHGAKLRALDAVVDSYIENLSEGMGENFAKLAPKALGKAYKDLAASTKQKLLTMSLVKAMVKANPGIPANKIAGFLKGAQWDGILPEMLEERAGEVMRAGYSKATTGESGYQLPTGKQLSAEFLSFMVPGGVSAIQTHRQFKKIDGALQTSDIESAAHLGSVYADTAGTAARLSDATGETITPEDVVQASKLIGAIEKADSIKEGDNLQIDLIAKAEAAMQEGDFEKSFNLKQMALQQSRQRGEMADREVLRGVNASRQIADIHAQADQMEEAAKNEADPDAQESMLQGVESARMMANRASGMVKIARGLDAELTTAETEALKAKKDKKTNPDGPALGKDNLLLQPAIDRLKRIAPAAAEFISSEQDTIARRAKVDSQRAASQTQQGATPPANQAPAPAAGNAAPGGFGGSSPPGAANPAAAPPATPPATGKMWRVTGNAGTVVEIPQAEAATEADARKMAVKKGSPYQLPGVERAQYVEPVEAPSPSGTAKPAANDGKPASKKWAWQGLTQEGVETSGEVEAATEAEAIASVRSQGHYPVSIQSQTGAAPADNAGQPVNPPVNRREAIAKHVEAAIQGKQGIFTGGIELVTDLGRRAALFSEEGKPRLAIDIDRFDAETKDLEGDALQQEVEKVIQEEWIHAGTVLVRTPKQAAKFWKKLTPEMQQGVERAYTYGTKFKGLTEAPKGYEAYRQFVQDAIDGKITENTNIPASLAQEIKDFLRDFGQWLAKQLSSLPKAQREAIKKDILAIKKALGILEAKTSKAKTSSPAKGATKGGADGGTDASTGTTETGASPPASAAGKSIPQGTRNATGFRATAQANEESAVEIAGEKEGVPVLKISVAMVDGAWAYRIDINGDDAGVWQPFYQSRTAKTRSDAINAAAGDARMWLDEQLNEGGLTQANERLFTSILQKIEPYQASVDKAAHEAAPDAEKLLGPVPDAARPLMVDGWEFAHFIKSDGSFFLKKGKAFKHYNADGTPFKEGVAPVKQETADKAAKDTDINAGDWVEWENNRGVVTAVWKVGRLAPGVTGTPKLEYAVDAITGHPYTIEESRIRKIETPPLLDQLKLKLAVQNNRNNGVVDDRLMQQIRELEAQQAARENLPGDNDPKPETSEPEDPKQTDPQNAAYQEAQAGMRDALKGLFSPNRLERAMDTEKGAGGSIEQLPVPEERTEGILKASRAVIKAGIRTPEALAKFLDDTFPGGKVRAYAESIWDIMGIVDKSLRGTHDWTAVFESLRDLRGMDKAERKAWAAAQNVTSLPDKPDDYFITDGATMVDVSKLIPTKAPESQPQSVQNAMAFAMAASKGRMDKRPPIHVRDNGDGTFQVIDGNATYGMAIQSNWKQLPVLVTETAKRDALRDPETEAETKALDAMYKDAERVWPQLDALTVDIAAKFGGTPITPPLKGRLRALQKGRIDYNGDFSKIKDLARATIEVQTLEQAQAAADEIEARTGQKPKRNLFKGDPIDGYRDALFHIKIDGVFVEIQVHVPEVLVVKKQLHAAYVRREEIIREAKAEGREVTESEQRRIDRMNRIMRKFYNAALGIPSGASSSASSGLTRNPPLALISSSEMGRGSDSSNAQAVPSASTTTANAPSGDSLGTSQNSLAPGNSEGFFTPEDTTGQQQNQEVWRSVGQQEANALHGAQVRDRETGKPLGKLGRVKQTMGGIIAAVSNPKGRRRLDSLEILIPSSTVQNENPPTSRGGRSGQTTPDGLRAGNDQSPTGEAGKAGAGAQGTSTEGTGSGAERAGQSASGGRSDGGNRGGNGTAGDAETVRPGGLEEVRGGAGNNLAGVRGQPPVIPTPEKPEDRNHRIDAGEKVAPRSVNAKIDANFKAIELLRTLEKEERNPNAEERAILEQYTGWGFIKEAFNTVRRARYDKIKAQEERYYGDKWEEHVVEEEDKEVLSWYRRYAAIQDRLKAAFGDKEFLQAEKSVRNAHYTTPTVLGGMWSAVKRLGFKGGKAVEPGGGAGHAIGTIPEDLANRTRWEAVELDGITARLLAKLYPQARVNGESAKPGREVRGQGFQDARIPNNSVDLFFSNVPFAKEGPGKSRSEFGIQFNLHNYFFARALAKTKPGGIIAFITSANTMESSRDQRAWLSQRSEFVGAIRLPNTAFKENAGTEVVTDIIFLRKPDGTNPMGAAETWLDTTEVGRGPVVHKRLQIPKGYRKEAEPLHEWFSRAGNDWIPEDENLREAWEKWRGRGKPKSGDAWKELMAAANDHLGDSTKMTFLAPIRVNEYFARHPEMVLGTHALAGSMYRPGEYTVLPKEGDLGEQMAAAIKNLPENIAGNAEMSATDEVEAESGGREFSYVERDGVVYQQTKDGMEPVEWRELPGMSKGEQTAAKTKLKKFRHFAKVRGLLEKLITAEANPAATDEELAPLRAELNTAYDAAVADYGGFSKAKRNPWNFLEDDPDYYNVQALDSETITTDDKGATISSFTKSDIFKKRLIPPYEPPTSAKSLEEAVSVSMAWEGRLNARYVGDLLGITEDAAKKQLLEKGMGFENPASGMIETEDEYLSGAVGQKLKEATEAALDDPKFNANVTALRAALPARKPISQASVSAGQRWIPDSIYNAFARSLGFDGVDVSFDRTLNRYEVKGRHVDKAWSVNAEWGPVEILEAILNHRTLNVTRYDSVAKKRVRDADLTALLEGKAREMKDAFVSYVKGSQDTVPSPSNAEQMQPVSVVAEEEFNDKVNSIVPPTYKGDWITLPNAAVGADGKPIIWLKPFRRAVLARFITEGRGMMAHGVGSGKTYNQIALAMELRRLGKARKPLMVVQGSTINQVAASFKKAYPNAKILVASPRSYSGAARKRFTARIATGDWDAVIMTHANIGMIPNKEAAIESYYAAELDELNRALEGVEKRSDAESDLLAARDTLMENRAKVIDQMAKFQDNSLTWEDLGIDALIVDEAHAFKNAPVVTMRGREVKNIPTTGAGALKAVSMMMKTASVRERGKGKGVFFATGTPVSNTMAEAFIMMRYIAPDILAANNIYNFDDFANQYGDVKTTPEATWNGTVKSVDRFAKFINGGPLVNMIRSVFDVALGNENLGINVPDVKGGKPRSVIVEPSEGNQIFNDWILAEVGPAWKTITRQDIEDNPQLTAVPIMTMQAGIAAALDPRMIHDHAPDDPNSKVNSAIREVLRIHKEGTPRKTSQVIFADLFNPFNMRILEDFAGNPFGHLGQNPLRKGAKINKETGEFPRGNFNLGTDIKEKLVKAGVPASEVYVVTDESDEKLTAILDKVNSGEIRVVIGSTQKLGVGVNMQERLAAAHHLMPPRDFKPAMMEQRNGRIIRQGNLHSDWRDLIFVDTVEKLGKIKFDSTDAEGNPITADKIAEAARKWLKENDKEGKIEARAKKAGQKFDVEIIEYSVGKSLDSAIYSMMAAKAGMIGQVLSNHGVADEFDDPTDELAFNFAENAANIIGDANLIRFVTLDRQSNDLRALYNGWRSRKSQLEADERNYAYRIATQKDKLKEHEGYAAKLEGIWEENEGSPVWTLGDSFTVDTGKTGKDDPKITATAERWLEQEDGAREAADQKERMANFTVNGRKFAISFEGVNGQGEISGRIGFGHKEFNTTYSGAKSFLASVHSITREIGRSPGEIKRDIEWSENALEQTSKALKADKGFPDLEKLRAMEAERDSLRGHIDEATNAAVEAAVARRAALQGGKAVKRGKGGRAIALAPDMLLDVERRKRGMFRQRDKLREILDTADKRIAEVEAKATAANDNLIELTRRKASDAKITEAEKERDALTARLEQLQKLQTNAAGKLHEIETVAKGYSGRLSASARPMADDMRNQEKWLDEQAKANGFADVDQLAQSSDPEDVALLERLAAKWRSRAGSIMLGSSIRPSEKLAQPEDARNYTAFWIDRSGTAFQVMDHLKGARDAQQTSDEWDSRKVWGYEDMWKRGFARVAVEPGDVRVQSGEGNTTTGSQDRWLKSAAAALERKYDKPYRVMKGMNMLSSSNRLIGDNKDFATPPADKDAVDALSTEKRPKFGLARTLKEGTLVGLRIDIPAFNRTGKYVVSVHEKAGSTVGKIIGYDTIVRVDNPTFFVNEGGSSKIRDGEAKFPIATVEGAFKAARDVPADINEWTPAGFDPKEHSYFYDKRTDARIVGGDEAISVGNSVFVKNPQYADVGSALYSGNRLGVDDPDFEAALDELNNPIPEAERERINKLAGFDYELLTQDQAAQASAIKREGVKQFWSETRDRETHRAWNQWARDTFQKDPEAAISRIVNEARNGFTGHSGQQAKLAMLVLEHLSTKAALSGDAQMMRDVEAITLAFDLRSTLAGREIAARWQPHATMEEQHRTTIAKAIYGPTAETRAKLDAAMSRASKNARIAELEAQVAELLAKAKKRREKPTKTAADKAAHKADLDKIEKLREELKETKQAQTEAEIMAEQNKTRLDEVQKAFEAAGFTLEEVMVDRAARLKLQGSGMVKRVLEAFNPRERIAIRAIMEGKTDRVASTESGVSRNKIGELEARFDAALDREVDHWIDRGFSPADMDRPDFAEFMDAKGGLFSPARPTLSPEERTKLRQSWKNTIHPPAQVRNNPARKKFKPSKAGGKAGIDISKPEHAIVALRAIQRAENNAFDMVYEYWINGILSGPATHVANVAGNTANAILEYGTRLFVEAPMNAALGMVGARGMKAASFGEFNTMRKWALGAAVSAFEQARKAWSYEVSSFEWDATGEQPRLDSMNKDTKTGYLNRTAIPGRVGRVVRVPSRALLFMDEFTKYFVGTIEASAQAHRIALADGLEGEALDDRVAELVRIPGSPAWVLALEKAHEMTFQQDLPKMLADGQAWLNKKDTNKATNAVRWALKFIFPFIKTPYNILATGVRKTPLGTLNIARKAVSGKYKDNGAGFQHDLAEQLLAWFAMAAVAGMAEGDPDDDKKLILITGTRGRDDRSEASLLNRSKGGETTILYKGKPVFNYGRYAPLATSLATVVNAFREMKKVPHGKSKTAAMGSMIADFVNTARSQTFLQGIDGLANFMASLSRESEGTEVQKMAKFLAQGVMPNLLRQPLRNYDDQVRDTKNAPWYYHMVPVGDIAEPLYDLYGRPVRKGGSALSRLFITEPTAVPAVAPGDKLLNRWNTLHPVAGEGDNTSYFPSDLTKSSFRFKDGAGKWQDMNPAEIREVRRRVGQQIGAEAASIGALPIQENIDALKKARGSALEKVKKEMFPGGSRPALKAAPSLRELLLGK